MACLVGRSDLEDINMSNDPFYYVDGDDVFHRPVENAPNPDGEKNVTMGFRVCTASPGINAKDIAALLNKAEPSTELKEASDGR